MKEMEEEIVNQHVIHYGLLFLYSLLFTSREEEKRKRKPEGIHMLGLLGLSRFFSFLEFSVIYWIRNNFLILCYVLPDPILMIEFQMKEGSGSTFYTSSL